MADTFQVERSIVIDAAPDAIRPHIENFHAWVAWSPYEGLDPNLARTYSGPESGVGATYAWSGNKKAGAGSMTITDVRPEKVTLDLEFTKPFANSNVTVFLLEPEGAGTKVTWRMTGKQKLVMKLFGAIMNMDKLVGTAFDEGLVNLKRVVEKG